MEEEEFEDFVPPPSLNEQLIEKFAKAKEDSRNLSCREYMDATVFCFCPPNQIRSYYRIGRADNCSRQMQEFFQCVRLKARMPDERRFEMMMKLQRKGEYSPTSSIWDFRESAQEAWEASPNKP